MLIKKIIIILIILLPKNSMATTQDLLLSLLAVPLMSYKVLSMLNNEINEKFSAPPTNKMAVVYIDRMIENLSSIGILAEHHPVAFHKLLYISKQSQQKVLFNCIQMILDHLAEQYMLVNSDSIDTIINTATRDIPTAIKSFIINESKEQFLTQSGAYDENYKILTGHSYELHKVIFAPNSKYLASSSRDASIRLWDLENNTVAILESTAPNTHNIVFSYDSSLIGYGLNSTIILWDIQAKKKKYILEDTEYDGGPLAISADNSMLAYVTDDQHIKIQKIEPNSLYLNLFDSTYPINQLVFSPDNSLLASAAWDNKILLWDVKSGSISKTLSAHTAQITDISFSQDSTLCGSTSRDQNLNIWRIKDGQNPRSFYHPEGVVNMITFAENSSFFASISKSHTISLWDNLKTKSGYIYQNNQKKILAISIMKDNTVLIAGSDNHKDIHVWPLSFFDYELLKKASENSNTLLNINSIKQSSRFDDLLPHQKNTMMNLLDSTLDILSI